jgi:hypothetical protein
MKTTIAIILAATLGAAGCGTEDDDPGAGAPAGESPRTEVPDELVGAWEAGYIDFELWEDYPEGRWAGRDAVPTREAMVFEQDGDAKFYRYAFARNLYEELVDCAGTVTFAGDGTFTFHPVSCRKRFNDFTNDVRDADRDLAGEDLLDPRWAGKRGYEYLGASDPPAIRITVPTSAPYNWYKKQ